MKKKSIGLICGSIETEKALVKQLREYLGDLVEIISIPMDEGIKALPVSDILLLSSEIVYTELVNLNFCLNKSDLIIAKRTVSYENLDQIVLMPHGLDVLFVNDLEETANEGIEALKEIGLDHINYIPYYPGKKGPVPELEYAITPGESDKVPPSVEKICDIGPRILDFATIVEIMYCLNLGKHLNRSFANEYLKKIISVSQRMALYSFEINRVNEQLSTVVDSIDDGILVYDTYGRITVCNGNVRKMLKIKPQNAVGRAIKDIIRNTTLIGYLMNKDENQDILIDIEGTEFAVSKFPIFSERSYIAIFKNIKETLEYNNNLRKEYINKGFYAKYSFSDIIGISAGIRQLKDTAKKLAKTDLTILIEGESGTGKELFASAIHNESKRKDGPYLAVNFSALPDELIESELFGYEEGAFTGAKKGGKPGLFEQCNGGTIFLDEIGDISLKVQARLLRVLESKEVMRIGGSEIKSINVRVIAATNKDLSKNVQENKFREDLYYRLKMGYLRLLPLRERKEDIQELIHYFISRETTEKITIAPEVMKILVNHIWLGNVRELRNAVCYMLAVKEATNIKLCDLPDSNFFAEDKSKDAQNLCRLISEEESFIVRCIIQNYRSGEVISREKLWNSIVKSPYKMSLYKLRKILDSLEGRNIIHKNRGREGIKLSDYGIKLLDEFIG
ncbi:MAG: sigma-54 interaction domain-containing protein [Caulobacteraceae bacterium]